MSVVIMTGLSSGHRVGTVKLESSRLDVPAGREGEGACMFPSLSVISLSQWLPLSELGQGHKQLCLLFSSERLNCITRKG